VKSSCGGPTWATLPGRSARRARVLGPDGQDQECEHSEADHCNLALFWVLLRQQAAVSDTQFLRSMIPHHAGAILMCEQAPLQDAEIKALCKNIVSGQQSEIDQMKAKLETLQR
jgi:uncharacterized protein (DUF305 family)